MKRNLKGIMFNQPNEGIFFSSFLIDVRTVSMVSDMLKGDLEKLLSFLPLFSFQEVATKLCCSCCRLCTREKIHLGFEGPRSS